MTDNERLQNTIEKQGKTTEWTQYLSNTSYDQQLYYGKGDNQIGADCSDVDLNSSHAVGEILRRADLDWTVYAQDGLGPKWHYRGRKPRAAYRMVEGVDDDGNLTGEKEKLLLGMATTRRQVFQNSDIFSAIVEFCNTNSLPILRAGSMSEGVKSFVVCGINEGFSLNNQDQVNAQLLVTHSHEVGSLTFAIITERLVCTNQLVLPVSIKQIKVRHTQTFSKDRAVKQLESLRNGVERFHKQAEVLSNRSIRTSDLTKEQLSQAQAWVVDNLGNPEKNLNEQPKYVQEMLSGNDDMLASAIALKSVMRSGSTLKEPEQGTVNDLSLNDLPPAYQEIIDLYHNGPGSELQTAFNTPWGILNAVTHHYTHNSAQKGGVSGHFNSLWTGAKANTTQYALSQAQAVSAIL